jgi:O-antigen ligase
MSNSLPSRIVCLLIEAPRWLLVIALVYAPWAYGCTPDWASASLAVILSLVVVLWIAGCVARRLPPNVPRLALVIVGCLLAQGWWMALNAKSLFASDLLAAAANPITISHRPGSIDGTLSVATMFLISALLGTMLFATDLATRPVWRKRLWMTLALTGLSIAFLGIIEKIGGDRVLSLIWEKEKMDVNNNFGMYRYRGNAGAYLNLVLPIIFGLAVETFRKRKSHGLRTAWAIAVLMFVVAIQLNPSRAGWGIAVIMSLILGGIWCWSFVKRSVVDASDLWRYAGLTAFFVVALATVCGMGRWQTSWRRLNIQGISPTGRSPTEVYLAMAPDAGLLGFGPGTFRAAFPGYQLTHNFGNRTVPESWISHSWLHAHQDYLQTVIEWGYVGALLWGMLVVAALWNGALHLRAAPVRSGAPDAGSQSHSRHRLLMFCTVLAILGVLLHACVDFPLQIASIQLYVAVLLGICWHRKWNDEPPKRQTDTLTFFP